MNIDRFIDKWTQREEDKFGETVFYFDLKLKFRNSIKYRKVFFFSLPNKTLNNTEKEEIVVEEQLQHPIIAMQEAEKQLTELWDDWSSLEDDCIWNQLMILDGIK